MTLFYMVIAWAAGIVLVSSARMVAGAWPFLVVAGIVTSFLMRREVRWRQVGLCIVALGLGIWRYDSAQPRFTNDQLATYNDGGYAEMVGIVVDEPDVRDNALRLRVDIQSIRQGRQVDHDFQPVSGLALVTVERFGGYSYGDKIQIAGEPRTPFAFDTFNYRDYLARSGVHTVIAFPKVSIVERGQGSPILAAMFDLKERSRQLIARLLPSPPSALLTGILLGNDNDLPPEIGEAFNATGTSHIIAISGANISVIAGLLLSIFGRFTSKRVSAILMIVSIAVYTVFVGASASVVRAAIMGTLAITAQRFGRRSDGLTALAASVWFMTILNPTLLFDVGLILSAAATLGLILYTKPLTQWAEKGIERLFSANTAKQVVGVLSDVVLLTLAAQITTLPIIFLIFGRFSAISFLVNILVVPAQAPIMILGIVAVVVGAIWVSLGQVVAWLVGIPLAYTLAIVRAAAQLPGASTPVAVDPLVVGAYYVILFSVTAVMSQPTEDRRALIERLRQNVSVPLVSILGLAVAGLLWAIVLSRPDGRLHVWFLAVGEGNAVLIQTPQGAHILIDGGENPTQLRTALGDRLPFYKRDLDLLIITQPSRFNISALPPLFERYAVKAVITNGQSDKDESYKTLAESLRGAKIEPLTLIAGYRLQIDDSVAIEVVNPESPPKPGVRIDDAPLMLRLTYGDASFLLTSSLSTKGTLALLDAAKAGRYLGATVLQLPAGGEMRIDDWLRLAAPQIAIFEAQQGGQSAKFVDAVSPLIKDIPAYRTDKHGTVEISTDGKQLWISTARQVEGPVAGK